MIPEGFATTTGLRQALSLSSNTINELKKRDDFPEPEGYYIPRGYKNSIAEYWSIAKVRALYEIVKQKPAGQRRLSKAERTVKEWEVPSHDFAQRKHCAMANSFHKALHLARG